MNDRVLNPAVPLKDWLSVNEVSDKMLWKGGYGEQIEFVMYGVTHLFALGLPEGDERSDKIVTVISHHWSKSIRLPVYCFTHPLLDLKVYLRDNFHDSKISVVSGVPITANFTGLFHTSPPPDPDYTGDPLHSAYFEGFPEELVFPYFSQGDGTKWSAALYGDKSVWTALFLMLQSLGAIPPLQWPTREAK